MGYDNPTPGGGGDRMEVTRTGSLAVEEELKRDVVQRLKTASGHLGAVQRMVDENAYCIDILKQVSAVQASLSKVARAISSSHMKHCVHDAIREQRGEEKIEELMEALRYLKHF